MASAAACPERGGEGAVKPLHLACMSCDPAVVVFSLRHLNEHLYTEHAEAMGLERKCRCGHRRDTHNPAVTRSYCEAASSLGPCLCKQFRAVPDAA